ncbi:protein kinase, putative [Talaromyces stipitatus ATCC 10500]|uniref:Protein kinase, putative n=1 Tax=Talaromyces stipitatus (strain ATCC 10500 / CBS 375.48 / QM 6759 / NRRL 1006) TaxID=441959 RepID=B8LUM8_TALSN|nr:protein kinase, putative [Talaromyces stipitatus ATCC 10500]EED23885.1 protein kinase, putative [Talaromyces stipitatus ATCC 10500]
MSVVAILPFNPAYSGWNNIDIGLKVEEDSIRSVSVRYSVAVRTSWSNMLATFDRVISDSKSSQTGFISLSGVSATWMSLHQLVALLPIKVMSSAMRQCRGKSLKIVTIYLSWPLPISYGTPVLCDLGEARLGTDQQQGDIMPDIYRAPEVILNLSRDYKVDIWNGGMTWDLFEHRHLFKARNPDRELDDSHHPAEMHVVLGKPPTDFLSRSEHSSRYWDKDRKWKGMAPHPDRGLETREERLQGDEKKDFLRFLRRMLCWLPEERATAKELIHDTWLMHGLFN